MAGKRLPKERAHEPSEDRAHRPSEDRGARKSGLRFRVVKKSGLTAKDETRKKAWEQT